MKELFAKTNSNIESWSETISSLGADSLLGMGKDKLAEYISTDFKEILRRQDIYRDCINNPILISAFDEICENIKIIFELKTKSATYSSMESSLYNFRTLELYIEMVLKIDNMYEELYDVLNSVILKDFLVAGHNLAEDKDFNSIREYIIEINDKLRTVRSFTIGINLNSKLEPSEIGIISMNDDLFVSSNFFTKTFSDFDGTRFVTPLVNLSADAPLLEQSLYISLNQNLVKAVNKARLAMISRMNDYCDEFLACYNDIRYLRHTVKFINGIVEKNALYCFPKVSTEKTEVKYSCPPTLLNKLEYKNIVKNDIIFERNKAQVYILTGANSGGKSVFLRNVGLQQILFQLGMPVVANRAEMFPVNNLLTHISTDIDGNDESRFVSECKRMREILDKTDRHTMILMDETFSGTGASEGAAVAQQVLKTICHRDCFCIYSTHLHEINSFINELNDRRAVVSPMKVETRDGKRTFRIIYNAADDYSHAEDIARKYGLEFKE